jgi:tRNA-splicing ligase RtcB
MAAVRTSIAAERLPDSLKKVRLAIEDAIPVGFSAHDQPAWRGVGGAVADEADALMRRFSELDPKVQALTAKAARQLGTLGGGNHFIELCVDTADQVWLMLHSGSRNVGKELAEVHMARARRLQHNQALVDRDLAVFLAGTPEMDAYRRDLYWAQEYARINREIMLALYQEVLRGFWPGITFADAVACHHNYVAEEVHYGESLFVTRKGAIRAGAGELGIIPGSMGTKSYIVRGRGNPEAFESASHGAGRRMSRKKAKSKYTVDDLREQTAGVECRKDSGVIDEIPAAYKSIDRVMEQQSDLVEIVAELKQVLCVKG